MAVNPVNLCADLQAWHSAGLSFLYFPELDARMLLNAPKKSRPAPARARPPAPVNVPASAPAQVSETTSQKTAMNIAEAGGSIGPDTKLPAHWSAVLDRVNPAPIVWTYLELGQDLFVQGDPGRSRALKELIGGLGLKGGTSAFLPVLLPASPPEAAKDGSEAWCFGAVLSRLNGRILVSFGSEALALTPYAALRLEPFHEKIVQGRIVLCLPSFAEILAAPARFEATKVFLRSAFAKINIL